MGALMFFLGALLVFWGLGGAFLLLLAWIDATPKPVPPIADRPEPAASSGTDTEFTAEVVRISEIKPHPNADRLEIAKFEMRTGPASYEVVVQKGQYQVGDPAAYLSVDCVVPTHLPQFKFLLERQDGKGKDRYRIRAARLRGTFSQGLLVEAPRGAQLGDSVAETYEVEYYRSPEEHEARGPTPPSGKKPKTQPFPVYGVDSLKKLPNLFAEGEPVYVTEKVHGSSFRAGWVPRKFLGFTIGWKFLVGSHRVMKGDMPSNHYYGEDVWLHAAQKHEVAKKTRAYKGYTFYGEIYGHTPTGRKIQDLTYDRKDTGLAIFDIRRPDGTWMPPSERRHTCAQLGLEHVPVMGAMSWSSEILKLAEGLSIIAAHIREGIVVESTEGPRRKAKYISQTYLLRKEAVS